MAWSFMTLWGLRGVQRATVKAPGVHAYLRDISLAQRTRSFGSKLMNPMRACLLLRDHDTERGILLRGAAEFAVAAMVRAQGWRPDSPDMPGLREALRQFLRANYREDGEQFLDALAAEADGCSKAARQELQALFPPLLMHQRDTVPTPCREVTGTRDVDETKTRQTRKQKRRRSSVRRCN